MIIGVAVDRIPVCRKEHWHGLLYKVIQATGERGGVGGRGGEREGREGNRRNRDGKRGSAHSEC